MHQKSRKNRRFFMNWFMHLMRCMVLGWRKNRLRNLAMHSICCRKTIRNFLKSRKAVVYISPTGGEQPEQEGVIWLIVVKVRENSLTIDGHAGYAEFGKDIVCAAVSALTQSFIKSVETLTTDKLKYKISSGNTVILHGDLSEKSQTCLLYTSPSPRDCS